MTDRNLLTKKEASEYTRLSRATLDRLRKSRHITFAKVGKKVLFLRKDLDAFIAARTFKAKKPKG